MPQKHYDIIVVGAGLSGIGAAWHLQKHCPDKSFTILEGRDTIGGTWDLFRYPGIRSDSDMFTLGYGFRPWRQAKTIADGPSIKDYVIETARDCGVDKKIQFNHWITRLDWSSDDAKWTVTATHEGREVTFTCNFLFMCSGYYRYAEGYTPDFADADKFRGRIVHPQHWPEDLDYAGKEVVVIGSGATAVTLIPSMADETAHITMLQRSPTYMISMPSVSPLAKFLSRLLPKSLVYRIMRWQRIVMQQFLFKRARAKPEKVKEFLLDQTREALGPDYDVETHFTPNYNPWEQRLCLVPDDDLFQTIKSGKASVVTDHIEAFTENGVRLRSGRELEADIIITATGLILEALGGADVTVDGQQIKPSDTYTYNGFMYSDIPNLASVFGYTNASWTLRADLVSEHVCRLINHMDETGQNIVTPKIKNPATAPEPFMDLAAGYVKRAAAIMPKQAEAPWRHPHDYAKDVMSLRYGKIDHDALVFSVSKEIADETPSLAAAE